MEQFNYKQFLKENRLTPTSILISEENVTKEQLLNKPEYGIDYEEDNELIPYYAKILTLISNQMGLSFDEVIQKIIKFGEEENLQEGGLKNFFDHLSWALSEGQRYGDKYSVENIAKRMCEILNGVGDKALNESFYHDDYFNKFKNIPGSEI